MNVCSHECCVARLIVLIHPMGVVIKISKRLLAKTQWISAAIFTAALSNN